MTFDLDDLPQDWAVWKSPDGWAVGEIYLDDHDRAFIFYQQGVGETVKAAFEAARRSEEEARERRKLVALELSKSQPWGFPTTDIGSPPQTAQEHIDAARVVMGSIR